MSFDLDTVSDLDQGFDNVQALRNILESLLGFRAHCAGDLRIVKALQEQAPLHCALKSPGLASYSSQLSDHIECAVVLTQRIHSLVDLVLPKLFFFLHHQLSFTVDLCTGYDKPTFSIDRQ